MANIAQGETECYISIEAECRVLYFTYSTWQGNDLSAIKNFLAIIIHIPIAMYYDCARFMVRMHVSKLSH